ncbi:MAG: OadG family protein [Clostridia bacterium]|nr:OadG family protein [Clostridia bacterium]
MDIKFQIPAADDFLTAALGITVVMATLALIAVFILLISKIIRIIEGKAKKAEADTKPAPAPAGVPMPSGMNNGEVDLIGVDEKTAAVIMAIVSQQSEIPLNRLSFKSIKLIDDGKKGGEA